MSFQFRSKANFQNFVQAIKSTNLQTHEPVNFKKTTKIEPHENKVFHSIPVWNANKIKEGKLTLLTFCTYKWSDKNTEIKKKKIQPKGWATPATLPLDPPMSLVLLFYHRIFLPDKYFTKRRHIHTRSVCTDAVTDVEPAINLKINFETKLIR